MIFLAKISVTAAEHFEQTKITPDKTNTTCETLTLRFLFEIIFHFLDEIKLTGSFVLIHFFNYGYYSLNRNRQ
jgi:hypothetical protein